jgi:hypothetical protein
MKTVLPDGLFYAFYCMASIAQGMKAQRHPLYALTPRSPSSKVAGMFFDNHSSRQAGWGSRGTKQPYPTEQIIGEWRKNVQF